MGYLQIKSTNKDFSYMLEKNPASKLQSKSVKKGLLHFWYSFDNTIINVYFKDQSDEISYPEHPDAQFEYNNVSKFNSARLYSDIIQELFNKARDKDYQQDVEGEHYSIFINLLYTKFKTIDIFQKYFTKFGIKFEYTEIVNGTNNYRISISTNTQKLKYLLNVVNLFTMIASLNSDDYIYITDDFAEKYVEIANAIDAPYFIKYLIKVRMIRSFKRFEKLKPKLDKSNSHVFDIEFGDTHVSRIECVKKYIFGNNSIVDIGSGVDYRYAKFLTYQTMENKKKYYAIDTDEEAIFKFNRFIQNNNIQFATISNNIDKVIEDYEFDGTKELVDILCTEVLEHNSLTEAKALVIKALQKFNVNKFFITVPNVDFNIHYEHEGFRHDDHKWEISFKDFQELINSCLISFQNKYEVEFFPVGDKVDGVAVSSGCIIKQINK